MSCTHYQNTVEYANSTSNPSLSHTCPNVNTHLMYIQQSDKQTVSKSHISMHENQDADHYNCNINVTKLFITSICEESFMFFKNFVAPSTI